jgi:hypothetical protein
LSPAHRAPGRGAASTANGSLRGSRTPARVGVRTRMPATLLLLLLLLPHTRAAAGATTSSDPVAVGRRAAASFVAHPNFTQPGCANCCFFCWNYGAGLIFDGLHELSAAGMLEPAQATLYRSKTDTKMDYFLAHNGSVPHDVLAGTMSPLTDYHDCGDSWMWGMNYLNRAIARPGYNSADQRVANLLGTNFSLHCPDRLPDTAHTFARPNGGDAWPTPTPEANFVWADGSFMGMVLPARLAVQGSGLWASDAMGPLWIGDLITMHVDGYRKYLRDPADNLYRHGYNYQKKEASCCKWGRANGWLMMSRVEVLLGARAVNADGEMKMHIAKLVDILDEHGTALCAHADNQTGRLHQLVRRKESPYSQLDVLRVTFVCRALWNNEKCLIMMSFRVVPRRVISE